MADCIYEEELAKEEVLQMEKLKIAIAKLDDLQADVQDPLQEINLGEDGEYKLVFISESLALGFREELISLLRKYRDCFTWDYSEMLGLDHDLVEHRLPIREGYRSFKQSPR